MIRYKINLTTDIFNEHGTSAFSIVQKFTNGTHKIVIHVTHLYIKGKASKVILITFGSDTSKKPKRILKHLLAHFEKWS